MPNSADSAYKIRAAVFGILEKDGKILLLKRFNTGWRDGYWGMPAGHLEEGESLEEGVIREIKEEAGVDVCQEDLRFASVCHRHEKDNYAYIDFYYMVKNWEGEPFIAEQDKANEIGWFSLEDLPDMIVPNQKAGIEAAKSNKALFTFT